MTDVRPIEPEQWPIIEWMWQAYRNDLAPIVNSVPRPDGRYNHSHLDQYPGHFWRGIATEAFGDDWTEEVRAVPGKPDVPPDHWLLVP